ENEGATKESLRKAGEERRHPSRQGRERDAAAGEILLRLQRNDDARPERDTERGEQEIGRDAGGLPHRKFREPSRDPPADGAVDQRVDERSAETVADEDVQLLLEGHDSTQSSTRAEVWQSRRRGGAFRARGRSAIERGFRCPPSSTRSRSRTSRR